MMANHREILASIKNFDQLIVYLRDEMGWPIETYDLEDLTFDYKPEELGIDEKNAAKIESIKRLRPLSTRQPWGIFFIKFEPKKLPVVALRRILSRVTLKKRASANSAERTAWAANDLLFISNYGEGNSRTITFAHFSQDDAKKDLPILKVLGWNYEDTALHLDGVASELTSNLAWPTNERDAETWRKQWRSAFTVGHREAITTSKALSIHLAKLAQSIRYRIKETLTIETEHGPLTTLMKAFKTALIHDLDADSFADMYAQTIVYGLLSARITNPKGSNADDLHIQIPVTNPFLKELLEMFLQIGGRHGKAGGPGIDFDELGINEVIELLNEVKMDAIIRDFGDRNPLEDPVIHFYELFLKEYDPRKRFQRGVFYTPRPVVSYIVRSVDELLRKEFDLQDGLADITSWGEMVKRNKDLKIPDGILPDQVFVQILDPATGTGTFLVEAINVIFHTMQTKWRNQGHSEKKIVALWNEYVPKHLLPRLHGYEILMAPYTIAHLKIGLKLYETGYRFESEERVRIYLTNSLERASDTGQLTLTDIFDAIAHEAQAVNEIKRNLRFTIVIGNPPYSKSSQNQSKWIEEIMEEYKRTVRTAETQIQALSDDYAKFIRFSHFTLEKSEVGILGFITNNGYLDGPLFRDMRSSMLAFFDGIRITNLHGDSRKLFSPPEGKADENIFDIQQGVATSLLWKKQSNAPVSSNISYAELWGTREERYKVLLSSLSIDDSFIPIIPNPPFFLFIPMSKELEADFYDGWHLYDIFGTGNHKVDNHTSYGAGFVTQQDKFAIGYSQDDISNNVREFLDPKNSDRALWERFKFCSTNQWNFKRAKQELKGLDIPRLTKRCLYRPFDYRFTVFNRNICTIIRKRITTQFDGENLGLLTTRRVTRLPYNNVFVTKHYAEYKVASHDRNTIVFPLWIHANDKQQTLKVSNTMRRLNFNPRFLQALAKHLGLPQESKQGLPQGINPDDIFYYIYAVMHSETYRSLYGEFLKIDFPRIQLTGNKELFFALARFGGELGALHLLESPRLDKNITKFIGSRNPEIENVKYSDETVWIDNKKTKGFKGVPEAVWNFRIGGYPICKKWLRARKGRLLSKEDLAHYQKIIVALSETIRLMQEIDDVIERHGGWPEAFHISEEKNTTPQKGLLDF